jgi:hypothetical protein
MRELSEEVYRRFPEIARGSFDRDPDLSYEVIGDLVHWLRGQQPPAESPDLLKRITAFNQWCLEQPRGRTAADDVFTILVVAFWEAVMQHDETRDWITYLVPKEELLHGRDYFIQWLGQREFDLAVAAYDRTHTGSDTEDAG